MWKKFHRLTNYSVTCFVDVNVITVIMVRRGSNVPAIKTLDTKQRTLVQVFVNHGVRVRWDDGRLVEMELPKESMVGKEFGVKV